MHNSIAPCMVITEDTTLTGNVGPCSGHGIVIAADNVTLDLNGFTVTGQQTPMEQAGVFFDNVSGSTVKNGTVTGFDAGVYIEGGSGNTVTGITAHRNINDAMEPVDPFTIIPAGHTGPLTPQMMHDIDLVTCWLGDGITTFASDNNVIEKNIVTENGPLSGISLVDDSDGNLVSKNEVHENDMDNRGNIVDAAGNPVWFLNGRHVPAGTPGATREVTSMCGGTQIGTPGMSRGRDVTVAGIRVEGPGANDNLVDKNTITKSGLAGIAVHSHIQFPAAPNVPVQQPNTGNVISKNSVSQTGVDTYTLDPYADGISSLSSGPIGNVTMPPFNNTYEKNVVFDNMRHGISLSTLTTGNVVDKNQVYGNAMDGILVAGGATNNTLTKNQGHDNGRFDGNDANPACDNNTWAGNQFVTFDEPCVVAGNTGKGRPAGAGTPGNRGNSGK
jgi:parallel beta-helix repeat protein